MVRRRPGVGATALAALLLLGSGIALASTGAGAAPPPPFHPSGLSGVPCAGSHIAARFPGSVATYHPYGTVPSVAGLNVTLDYEYQQNDSSPLGHSVECLAVNVTTTTGSNGAFLLEPTVPASNCSGVKSCIENSGPFGPFSFHLNRSDPPGNFLRVGWALGRVELVWTSAFDSIVVDPTGPIATSTGDPVNLTAEGLAGDGSRSPAQLAFAWAVTGPSWSSAGNRSTAGIQVESNGSGGTGVAKVEVRGSYNGTALGAIDASVDLAAVATTAVTGSTLPAEVDVGQRVPVEVVADGASGFTYSAEAHPGLGQPAVPLRCTTTSGGSGDVVVDCKGDLEYEGAGTADPQANISNGFSTASWNFGNLSVVPSPTFAFGPDPAMGYTNSTIAFELDLAGATGTPPFGPACLASGTGGMRCASSGGPNWTIPWAYPVAGQYNATASIVDGAGVNESRSVPVLIADPPRLGTIPVPDGPQYVGHPMTLTAELSGGLWPGAYYWNDSAPVAATLSHGAIDEDGPVSLPYEPGTPGVHDVSLVVVDALGSRVASTISLHVGAGAAVHWDVSPGGNVVDLVAGQPANLTVRMVDAYGDTVVGYAPELLMSAHGPGTSRNLSVVGSNVGGPAGTPPQWIVSPGAWSSNGLLNLSLGSSQAGTWVLNVSTAEGLPMLPLPITLDIRADAEGPRLVDPTNARQTARSASTLWGIEDPYGNPIPGGYIVVRTAFPSGVLDVDEPIAHGKVWVNYTAIGNDAGTVVVLSAYGIVLLPTILVPAVAVPSVPWDGATILSGSAIVTAAALVFAYRGRRRPSGPEPPGGEAELERHAAGRDHLLRRLADRPADSLAYLASGWTGPAPRPERREVVEWLTALIAEGLVVAQNGPDGRPLFLKADDREVRSDLVLDESALEQALAHRDSASAGEEGSPAGGP